MSVPISSPRIYKNEHGLKHRDLTEQLLNYLRAAQIEIGILLNFGPKAEFKRRIFDNSKKNPRKSALISGEDVQ